MVSSNNTPIVTKVSNIIHRNQQKQFLAKILVNNDDSSTVLDSENRFEIFSFFASGFQFRIIQNQH